ncbi:redoxin domain-containing protein [Dehalococcoides mccartyi]|nr:redoxin domain-containing protein [Dehalococcoides mccartyi]
MEQLEIGTDAPAFQFESAGGNDSELLQFRGKTVVIFFIRAFN